MSDAAEPPCAGTEMIALRAGHIERRYKDPVCGKIVARRDAVVREAKDGTRCHFCSLTCLGAYYLNPMTYVRALRGPGR